MLLGLNLAYHVQVHSLQKHWVINAVVYDPCSRTSRSDCCCQCTKYTHAAESEVTPSKVRTAFAVAMTNLLEA